MWVKSLNPKSEVTVNTRLVVIYEMMKDGYLGIFFPTGHGGPQ